MRNFLSILIVASIILAGISPACKFISGKGLFEICSFGSDEPVAAIDEALLAYLPDYEPENEHKDLKQNCDFCLLHAYGKIIKPPTTELFSGIFLAGFYQSPEKPRLFINDTYTPQIPRAPPLSILS